MAYNGNSQPALRTTLEERKKVRVDESQPYYDFRSILVNVVALVIVNF